MATRVIGTLLIGSNWCALRGVFSAVTFTGGGSCPASLPYVTFEWTKQVAALSAGEQSQVSAARSMLQGKLDAEEACSDLRSVNFFNLVLGAGGVVENAAAWLNGPTVAGKQRQVWSRWVKARAAFSSPERTQLDAVVTMLAGHLATEEPL